MKISLNFSQFCDEWNRWDERKNTFSYNGKRALFDYIQSVEEDTGEEIELDIISLCCEYTEYEGATEAASEYSTFEGMKFNEDGSEAETAEDVEKKAHTFLEENTTVLDVNGTGVIIANF